MNFIKKFWSGDVSMVKSFWIFNIIIDQVQIALFAFIIIMNSLEAKLFILITAEQSLRKTSLTGGQFAHSSSFRGVELSFPRIK